MDFEKIISGASEIASTARDMMIKKCESICRKLSDEQLRERYENAEEPIQIEIFEKEMRRRHLL